MLDNFDHIKAYWVMLGKATAQTALHFGANDLDLRLTDGDELTQTYCGRIRRRSKNDQTRDHRMIHRDGVEPVERDTLSWYYFWNFTILNCLTS